MSLAEDAIAYNRGAFYSRLRKPLTTHNFGRANMLPAVAVSPLQRLAQAEVVLYPAGNGVSRRDIEARITQAELATNENTKYSATDAVDVNDDDVGGRDEIVRVDVDSYGISCTWGFLRHVYLRIGDVEVHAGMTEDHTRQLVYATRDYYGHGRNEGHMFMCTRCANAFLHDIEQQCQRFFLPFTNCDTIVPVIMQTSFIWLAVLGLVIGTILSTRTQNFFTFALFVPMIAFAVTLLYNRFVVRNDGSCAAELSRCYHIERGTSPPKLLDRTRLCRHSSHETTCPA